LLFPPSDNHSNSFQFADARPYRDLIDAAQATIWQSLVSKSRMRHFVLLTAGLLILSARLTSAQDGLTCKCGNGPDQPAVCLTEAQMSDQVKHIEMQNDRMGNHVNVNGVAVFEITIGKKGRIVNAKAVSGHPLALPLLLRAMDKWQFKPLVRNETARQACGRLSLKFSIVENLSTVEVVRP